jgi:hypothetical protein
MKLKTDKQDVKGEMALLFKQNFCQFNCSHHIDASPEDTLDETRMTADQIRNRSIQGNEQPPPKFTFGFKYADTFKDETEEDEIEMCKKTATKSPWVPVVNPSAILPGYSARGYMGVPFEEPEPKKHRGDDQLDEPVVPLQTPSLFPATWRDLRREPERQVSTSTSTGVDRLQVTVTSASHSARLDASPRRVLSRPDAQPIQRPTIPVTTGQSSPTVNNFPTSSGRLPLVPIVYSVDSPSTPSTGSAGQRGTGAHRGGARPYQAAPTNARRSCGGRGKHSSWRK